MNHETLLFTTDGQLFWVMSSLSFSKILMAQGHLILSKYICNYTCIYIDTDIFMYAFTNIGEDVTQGQSF